MWHLEKFSTTMAQGKKNGRVPGILWNTPTYVTELVGYLYRRSKTAFVCVFSLKFLWGRASRRPTGTPSLDRFSNSHSPRRSPDRDQRVLRGRRSVAAFGAALAAAAIGGGRTRGRASCTQPAGQSGTLAFRHSG